MKKKKREQTEENEAQVTNESEKAEKKPKERKWGKFRQSKKVKNDQIIRIEELEELMSKYGDDVDPEAIVSMYVPYRRRKRIAAALLRMDKVQIALLSLMLVVCVLFVAAFAQEKMGNFTINLDRLELYRKGISIADNGDFNGATARLKANAVKDARQSGFQRWKSQWQELHGIHLLCTKCRKRRFGIQCEHPIGFLCKRRRKCSSCCSLEKWRTRCLCGTGFGWKRRTGLYEF